MHAQSLPHRTDRTRFIQNQSPCHQRRTLLEGIVMNPDARISEMPLLIPAKREQLFVEWNNNRRFCPTNVCIHELAEAEVDRTPDPIAVACEKESLTCRAELVQWNQLDG
jgi:non-ribosomal peptide synthetase component F